jgi:predicted enzyme related to lactoylglutathione lyase
MGQPVVHFEVHGKDREALTRFYAELFHWKTNDISEMNSRWSRREATEGSMGDRHDA